MEIYQLVVMELGMVQCLQFPYRDIIKPEVAKQCFMNVGTDKLVCPCQHITV